MDEGAVCVFGPAVGSCRILMKEGSSSVVRRHIVFIRVCKSHTVFADYDVMFCTTYLTHCTLHSLCNHWHHQTL